MAPQFTKATRRSPWILIALGVVFVLSNDNIKPVKGQRFCGKVLTDTLTAYCDIFPTLAPAIKRSQGQAIKGINNGEDLFPIVPIIEGWGKGSMANSKPNWMKALFSAKDGNTGGMSDAFNGLVIPDGFQLSKRGVVDDCCYRSCSLEYLLTNYCG